MVELKWNLQFHFNSGQFHFSIPIPIPIPWLAIPIPIPELELELKSIPIPIPELTPALVLPMAECPKLPRCRPRSDGAGRTGLERSQPNTRAAHTILTNLGYPPQPPGSKAWCTLQRLPVGLMPAHEQSRGFTTCMCLLLEGEEKDLPPPRTIVQIQTICWRKRNRA